jgi:hypothetical protein
MGRYWRNGMGLVGLLLAGCALNTPPLYESRAEAFLKRQGVAEASIERRKRRQPLEPGEVRQLGQYKEMLQHNRAYVRWKRDGAPLEAGRS